MKHLLGTVLVLAVACGDDDGSPAPREDAGRADAAVTGDASTPLDARTSPPADAATTPTDAAAPGDDASAPTDAAAPLDAASQDPNAPQSLRQTVCGDKTDWPDPLPAMNMRSARKVQDGFGFVEGPVWVDGMGVLLFSDMNMGGSNAMGPPSQIRRQRSSSFDVIQPASGSNGLALFTANTVIAATHDTRSLSFFDPLSGARTNIAITYQGKKFNSPNDLTVRDDGWVYFSDPDWQLGARTSELKMGVYRVQLSASTTTASALLIDDTQNKPNGVALSPDQKTLYVGSSDNDIFKWTVNADGSVSNKTSFARPGGGSDGMGVDCAGNLYVASGGVQVFSPSGSKLGTITLADGPTNVAFGGPGKKTLYITAQDTLYAIDLNVPGFPY